MLPQGEQKRGGRVKRDERQGRQVGEAPLTLHEKLCILSVCFLFGGEKTVAGWKRQGNLEFFWPCRACTLSSINYRRRRQCDQE